MLSGFRRKEINLEINWCSATGKIMSQLIFYVLLYFKILCLISVFEVYPTSNKCVFTLILDIFLDKKAN